MSEIRVIMQNMPLSVRGCCYHDADGTPYIILNSRLTREQNKKTWRHELKHILRGDMFKKDYNEYEG